jgi:hypothetical protein
MTVLVKGVKIKLLDTSMIRRYGSLTPLLDPSVAKILVNKGCAIYLDKQIEENVGFKRVIELEEEDELDNRLFPEEIIRE